MKLQFTFNIQIVLFMLLNLFAFISWAGMPEKNDNEMTDSMVQDLNQSIIITDGWVRQTPPVASNSAAYFTLRNNGNKDLTLVSITSTASESTSMHDVVIENSMARMVHLKALKIPAEETIRFAPAGKHLMLINLTEKLQLNKTVSFTFTFDNGQSIVSSLPILKQAPGPKN